MNIIVNGTIFGMEKGKDRIAYETLAHIAGHDHRHLPTITYRSEGRSGSIHSGEILLVDDGMHITCSDTIDA